MPTVYQSLGYYKERSVPLLAFCQQDGPQPWCRHYGPINIDKAIEKFGADFLIPREYDRFISSLRCAKCGSRKVSIQIGDPEGAGGYRG